MTQPTRIANWVISHHKLLDYMPIASTAVGLVYLFQKYVIIPLAPYSHGFSDRYFTHLQSKNFLHCLVILLPGVGNLLIAIVDFSAAKYKQYSIAGIRKDPRTFIALPFWLKLDPEIKEAMIQACLSNPQHLPEIYPKLGKFGFMAHEDARLVVAAVNVGVSVSLRCMSEEFTDDKTFMLKVLQKDGTQLEYASDQLKGDPEVVNAAILQNPEASSMAANSLLCDKGFVLGLVKKLGKRADQLNWFYINESLKKDPSFVLEAVGIMQKNEIRMNSSFADESLFSDAPFMLKLVQLEEDNIFYAADSLKENPKFMLEAMKTKGTRIYYHLSQSLKEDPEFMLEALKIKKELGDYLNTFFMYLDALKKNRDFMLAAIAIYPPAFSEADLSLQTDESFKKQVEALRVKDTPVQG